MRRGSLIWAKGALLIFSLVFSALLFELGILVVVGEQAKFPRHVVGTKFRVRVNEPGAHYRHKSADGTFWFDINSRGLRDEREFSYEKPAGMYRIVSLGDSFTVGYEVQSDETFSSVLESELRDAGLEVEVLNAGVSGYSNAEALVYLERELLRYDPDLILLSFYANDLVDNMRTGLFKLEDGRLVEAAKSYVPGGGLGNFLNTNWAFNWLSGYSNAFVLVKERLTHLTKRGMVSENEANVADAVSGGASEVVMQQRALAVAILDRLYETAHSRRIPLIIQSIPHPVGGDDPRLLEMFPVDEFDRDREGLYFVSLVDLMNERLATDALYNRRSHGHWTPISHRISGEILGRVVLENGLLGKPEESPTSDAEERS